MRVFGATVAGDLIKASLLRHAARPHHPRDAAPAAACRLRPAQGEMRFTLDRKQPERTSREGDLRIEALDLTWLAGKQGADRARGDHCRGHGLRVTGARFGVEDQFFELRGGGGAPSRAR